MDMALDEFLEATRGICVDIVYVYKTLWCTSRMSCEATIPGFDLQCGIRC